MSLKHVSLVISLFRNNNRNCFRADHNLIILFQITLFIKSVMTLCVRMYASIACTRARMRVKSPEC